MSQGLPLLDFIETHAGTKVASGQALAILNHLQSGKSITPLESLELFGCLRLGNERLAALVARSTRQFKFDKAMQAHITKRLAQTWHIASTSDLREFPSPYPGPGELPDALERKPRRKRKAKATKKLTHPELKKKVDGTVVKRRAA